MKFPAVRLLLVLGAVLGLLAACSGSSDTDESGTAGSQTSCEASARQVIDRLDTFLEPYADLTPDAFLADPELDGLDDFQQDVAALVVDVATNPNDDCTERDLERHVAEELENYGGDGLLNRYLVGVVRQGLTVERRDIRVTPDDDLIDLLPVLGAGSSITFSEGTFVLDATVLVQSELVLIGAGREATVIESSADSAAIAVLGNGDLVMNDLTIRHVGDLPASVVLAIEASVEMVDVGLHGGIVDEEGAGGSGLVITAVDGGPGDASVTVDRSVLSDHGAAGIAVTGGFAPVILDSTIEDNAQCGICFFDTSGGQVQRTTFAANGVGLQTSSASSPEIAHNTFVDNAVAGVLVEDESLAVLVDNRFEGVDIVGIDVQGAARPIVQRNTFVGHAVAISLRGMSTASVSANQISGGDVGILTGGSANPEVFENDVDGTEITAILHTEASTGSFVANGLRPAAGAGIVAEGTAQPIHRDGTIDGGLVGMVFRQDSGGRVSDLVVSGQEVGVETSEAASVVVVSNRFIGTTQAAAILGDTGGSELRDNLFEEVEQIGIQTGGDAVSVISGNTVRGGDTALLVTEMSAPTVTENLFEGQSFGVGVSGSATPTITSNEIRNSAAGAMSFEGDSGGEITDNMIIDAGVVGIRVAGDAAPTFENNTLFARVGTGADGSELESDAGSADDAEDADSDAGSADDAERGESGAGFLFAEGSSGTAEGNQLFGFIIGIQVGDDAAPSLLSNRVDGAGPAGVGILYALQGGGTADGNEILNHQLGFQLSGTATPVLTNNRVTDVLVAAFLIQGEATPEVDGNLCPSAPAGIVVLESGRPSLGTNECPLVS